VGIAPPAIESGSEYYVTYGYEYEYEYDDDEPGAPEEPARQISPPRPPPTQKLKPKSPGKLQRKAFDFEPFLSESESASVQMILGVRSRFRAPDDQRFFFVKFIGVSYPRCDWVAESEISHVSNGDLALRRFQAKTAQNRPDFSLYLPALKVCNERDVETIWWEVDRVVRQLSEGSNAKYLVKWQGLEQDYSTVEPRAAIPVRLLRRFERARQRLNPKKIPTHWVHPDSSSYAPLSGWPLSSRGRRFRPFQLDGLNWLRRCWYDKRSSILGDPTRLGKRATAVAMLSFLAHQYQIHGPFLVLTMPEGLDFWRDAFDEWSEFKAVSYTGTAQSRGLVLDREFQALDEHARPDCIAADVLILPYDQFLQSNQPFAGICWRYVIADDGLKMKDPKGRVRLAMNSVIYEHLTLLIEDRERLQKNACELFRFLSFLDPSKFSNAHEFLQKYPDTPDGELNPEMLGIFNEYFLARDLDMIEEQCKPKAERLLLCEPSVLQRWMYRDGIKQHSEILLSKMTDFVDSPLISLMNLLRKICNHPLLIDENLTDSVVDSSSKMNVVHKLIRKFLAEGKKILIFSQIVRILDILEWYLTSIQMPFLRIDCWTSEDVRLSIASDFKSNDVSILLFCSKPDGFQLPMDIADVVIVYDCDVYHFDQDMQCEIIHLVISGSHETELVGSSCRNLCFDDSLVHARESRDFNAMNAEDIELLLRDSIAPMFQGDDATSIRFAQLPIETILAEYSRDEVAAMEAQIDIAAQREFWMTWLEPTPIGFKPKDSTGDLVKKLKRSIAHRGFRGGEDELDFLKCALTLSPPNDPETCAVLFGLVGDNSSDEPVRRFGEFEYQIDKFAPDLFQTIVFFERLKLALFCAQKETLVWPVIEPVWGDPSAEYKLLHSLNENGFKRIANILETNLKSPTKPELQKRVKILVKAVLRQFPGVVLPPEYDLMTPEEWRKAHLVLRESITDDEFFKLYQVIDSFGIPHLANRAIDIEKVAGLSNLDDVHPDYLERCVVDIVSMSVELRTDSSKITFEPFPAARPLEGRVSASDFRRLAWTCRHFEKIYGLAMDEDLSDDDLFAKVVPQNVPDFWDASFSQGLLFALMRYGANDVSSWGSDSDLPFTNDFLEGPRQRLEVAAEIVRQIRGSQRVRVSATLEVDCFGTVVNDPSFKSRDCLYPVGFVSRKNVQRLFPPTPAGWFRCEIQSVVVRPLFVVCDPDGNEVVELTPQDAWIISLRKFVDAAAIEEVFATGKLSGEALFGLTADEVVMTIADTAKKDISDA
jgi:chromodomain-helicase-DNA-binding protein 7